MSDSGILMSETDQEVDLDSLVESRKEIAERSGTLPYTQSLKIKVSCNNLEDERQFVVNLLCLKLNMQKHFKHAEFEFESSKDAVNFFGSLHLSKKILFHFLDDDEEEMYKLGYSFDTEIGKNTLIKLLLKNGMPVISLTHK